MLTNLVGNAVKFTDRARVTLALSYDADGRLVAEVSDTGPGLAEADLAKLFQRFSQVDGFRGDLAGRFNRARTPSSRPQRSPRVRPKVGPRTGSEPGTKGFKPRDCTWIPDRLFGRPG
jgi:YD repeat-containing protein